MRHFLFSTEPGDHRSRKRLLRRWWVLGVVVLLVGLAAAGPPWPVEKIGQEGLVSVLAAIAGYASGKQSSTN